MKMKIDKGVPLPDGAKVRGKLEEVYAPIYSKMKIGDSIKFPGGRELDSGYNYACRYSRRYKKNEWRFRTSQVGEYRMWRTA